MHKFICSEGYCKAVQGFASAILTNDIILRRSCDGSAIVSDRAERDKVSCVKMI